MIDDKLPERVNETYLRELRDAKGKAAFKRSNAQDQAVEARAVSRLADDELAYWEAEQKRLEDIFARATDRWHDQEMEKARQSEGRRKPGAAAVDTGATVSSKLNGATKLTPVERLAAQAEAERALAPAIEVGDHVMQKSGGPRMFVYSIDTSGRGSLDDRLWCEWSDEGRMQRSDFKRAEVMFVSRTRNGQVIVNVAAVPAGEGNEERTERVRIDDAHANVPRRKFLDLDPAEQEAAQLIDGDQNPRWKLPDGELVDSDLEDGKQPDKEHVEASFRKAEEARKDQAALDNEPF